MYLVYSSVRLNHSKSILDHVKICALKLKIMRSTKVGASADGIFELCYGHVRNSKYKIIYKLHEADSKRKFSESVFIVCYKQVNKVTYA